MATLITSDLHLTDKDRDEYRWGLFDWIQEQIPKYGIDTLLFLGDTTDLKDRHSSKLTNRIVNTFHKLSLSLQRFIILRGNHDYIDEQLPFFKFLNEIKGIQFVIEPYEFRIGTKTALAIPNMRSFEGFEIADYVSYLFCHQTFSGARVETNRAMEGIDPHIFDGKELQVISGDVHVPQKLGDKITYVGAPYHVRYNDSFIPRLLLIDDDDTIKSLKFKTISKYTINISNPAELANFTIQAKDQVKVRLHIEDMVNWKEYKTHIQDYCTDKGIDLHMVEPIKQDITASLLEQKATLKSLSPVQLFEKYCTTMKVGEGTASYGRKIIEENK